MASILDFGAGAGEGFQVMLDRMARDRAARLAEAQLAEKVRSDQADEGYKTQALGETSKLRMATQAGVDEMRRSNMANLDADNTREALKEVPGGTEVTPEYAARGVRAGIPAALFPTTKVGGTLQAPDQGPTERDATVFSGFKPKDAATRNPDIKTMVVDGKPEDVIVGSDGKVKRVSTGEDVTSKVSGHYERPPAPQQPDRTLTPVYDPNSPTGSTYQSRSGAAGQPAPASGATRTMMEGARQLQPHIDSLREQADVLDKAGLFGPVMSRIRHLAEGVGTIDDLNEAIATDPELSKDRRVGRFSTSLGLLATGAGRVHGGARGGGSPQMLQHFKALLGDSSTNEMFQGRLDGLDDYMGGYAQGPQAPGRAAPTGGGGSDPYTEYLNRNKGKR